jgi:AmpD protein
MLIKRWIPSPFIHERPAGCPLDMIVIHHIGSKNGKLYTISGTIAWFTNESLHVNKTTGVVENRVSAHYIIPRSIYEKQTDMIALVKHEEVAYHAGDSSWTVNGVTRSNINNYSIGIELEGDGNAIEYTDFQYDRLTKLVKELMQKYNITDANIVGHEDIAPGRKTDPGIFFDWKRLRVSIAPKIQIVVPDTDSVPERKFHRTSGMNTQPDFLSKLRKLFNR